jgi:hypothetical protein
VKAVPSAKKSPPGSTPTFPSSSASPQASAAPSFSVSSAAAYALSGVALNSGNMPMPTRHHNLTKGDAIGAVPIWLLRLCGRHLWVSLLLLLVLRPTDSGRRIHMRRRGVYLSHPRCIIVGVLCGMHRKIVVVVTFFCIS